MPDRAQPVGQAGRIRMTNSISSFPYLRSSILHIGGSSAAEPAPSAAGRPVPEKAEFYGNFSQQFSYQFQHRPQQGSAASRRRRFPPVPAPMPARFLRHPAQSTAYFYNHRNTGGFVQWEKQCRGNAGLLRQPVQKGQQFPNGFPSASRTAAAAANASSSVISGLPRRGTSPSSATMTQIPAACVTSSISKVKQGLDELEQPADLPHQNHHDHHQPASVVIMACSSRPERISSLVQNRYQNPDGGNFEIRSTSISHSSNR